MLFVCIFLEVIVVVYFVVEFVIFDWVEVLIGVEFWIYEMGDFL